MKTTRQRTAWAVLVPVAALAQFGIAGVQPAAAAAQDIPNCVKLVVRKDTGSATMAFRAPVWDTFFDAAGNAIGSRACFDTVHVDSIRVDNGPCRAAGFHEAPASAGWNRQNVRRAVPVGAVAPPGTGLRIRFYNSETCTDLMADRQFVRVANTSTTLVYRTS